MDGEEEEEEDKEMDEEEDGEEEDDKEEEEEERSQRSRPRALSKADAIHVLKLVLAADIARGCCLAKTVLQME